MALNASTLADLIRAQLPTWDFVCSESGGFGNEFIDAIAAAVVSHITTSAVVQTTAGAPDGEHTGVVQ